MGRLLPAQQQEQARIAVCLACPQQGNMVPRERPPARFQTGDFCPRQNCESNSGCQNDQDDGRENPAPRLPNCGFLSLKTKIPNLGTGEGEGVSPKGPQIRSRPPVGSVNRLVANHEDPPSCCLGLPFLLLDGGGLWYQHSKDPHNNSLQCGVRTLCHSRVPRGCKGAQTVVQS